MPEHFSTQVFNYHSHRCGDICCLFQEWNVPGKYSILFLVLLDSLRYAFL